MSTSFEMHRSLLMGLAYRMLGSRTEAEDIVQEAYIRWHGRKRAEISDARAYLTTIVSRLCLDHMKSARTRREIYVGPWLPEPVVDEAFDADSDSDLAHDISIALMIVLERLSPLERAAFILHDIFELDFAKVAAVLGRTEATCRQLAARARGSVHAGRPRFSASLEEGQRLVSSFRAAAKMGDLQGLAQLLADDAVLYSDGGGKRPAALNPIYGAEKILRFLAGVARKNFFVAAMQVRDAMINGSPGLLFQEADRSLTAFTFEYRANRIVALYLVRNPDKLRHVVF